MVYVTVTKDPDALARMTERLEKAFGKHATVSTSFIVHIQDVYAMPSRFCYICSVKNPTRLRVLQ